MKAPAKAQYRHALSCIKDAIEAIEATLDAQQQPWYSGQSYYHVADERLDCAIGALHGEFNRALGVY